MKYLCNDGNGEIEIEADSAREAAEQYVSGDDWGDRSSTVWVEVRVTPIISAPDRSSVLAAVEAMNAGHIIDHGDHLTLTVAEDYAIDELRAALPAGAKADWAGSSNTDAQGDTTEDIRIEWCDEHGDDEWVTITVPAEDPDCDVEGGHDWQSPHQVVGGIKENPGVSVHGGGVIITEVCSRCGIYRITDTWAQNPSTGEQGLESVEFRASDAASRAWLKTMRDEV